MKGHSKHQGIWAINTFLRHMTDFRQIQILVGKMVIKYLLLISVIILLVSVFEASGVRTTDTGDNAKTLITLNFDCLLQNYYGLSG